MIDRMQTTQGKRQYLKNRQFCPSLKDRPSSLSVMSTDAKRVRVSGQVNVDGLKNYTIFYNVCQQFLAKLQDLKVLRTLGSGVSAYVKKVIHVPSGEMMAIKVISMTSDAVNRTYLARELNALRYAESPYCIDFYGATSYVGYNRVNQ